MADDAGFAVALTIREHLINDALLLAYAGGGFPRSLSLDLPGGPPDANIDVYLAPARITCNEDDTLLLAVRLWGSLKITIGGTEYERTIDGRLGIRIAPTFVVSGTNLVLSPDPDDVVITQWSYTVISGGSFPADVDLYLQGGLFRNRLRAAVQLALGAGLVPGIDISFVGAVLMAMGLSAVGRTKAGVLLVGLNIESAGTTIVGDPDLLYDFARGNDIAAATNALAVPLVLRDVASTIGVEVANNGATLDGSPVITCEDGQFRIAVVAHDNHGTVHFDFAVVPSMVHTTPGAYFTYLEKPVHVNARTFPALGFSTTDIHVDLDLSFWWEVAAIAGSIISLGVIAVWVDELLGSIANHLRSGIAAANLGPVIPRVQRTVPNDPGGAVVRIEITAYDITTAGVFMGLTVQPELPPVTLIGPATVPADLSGQRLRYLIRLPIDVHDDDPRLRIRWTVFDPASGNLLTTQDNVAAGRTSFDLVPQVIGPGLASLGIACRVYRTLGPEIIDLVNEGMNLTIRGPLPPGAYRRWRYDVKNPHVVYDAQTDRFGYAGERVLARQSNLHRTDAPQACKNATKSSRYTYQTDVLDTLPFAVADIALHRAELCDYCFYGGPAGLRPRL